ncbi:MAG: abortive infection protein [Tissierellia bacterium]|nr:abortive infection protein [Tissierellia bacterium]
MNQVEKLLQLMNERDGTITTKEAVNLGIRKNAFQELEEKGEVVRIAEGLYALPGEDIDEYIYFSHRVPKGIFSHDTAAFLWGLQNRSPLIYHMTIQSGSNVSRIKERGTKIIFHYIKEPLLELGKTKVKNPFGREIIIYDRERTILDIIRDKNSIDPQIFTETLKSYFEYEEKNMRKLYKYAKEMNLLENLSTYTEVLL